ncbi:MAG: ATP-binding cassette domain-containing protein [Bacteroidetes bacterium]|nr:MAG: ATP-binding cassette domain-containing protein [Bacteroidota bacterium]
MSVLKLENVVKTYQNHVAVDHVSFEVPKGAIFGLLGPNGAGKTSLIRIITTITGADEGRIFLDGEKLNFRHPEVIGYMPEERGLYKKMKVGEQIMYLAQLKGLSPKEARAQIGFWFKRFEIEDWWDKKVEELSKGMQQKVQFIATVVHRPKLLILDEPFSGLDPINTNLIKDEIRRLNAEGVSVIFSTHRMEQVEEICEDIVLINEGKNILQGKVEALKQAFKEHLFKIEYAGELPDSLRAMDAADDDFEVVSNENHTLVIRVSNDVVSNKVLEFLIRSGVFIHEFQEILPSLNEIFIRRVSGAA